MARIRKSIEVNAPVHRCFELWSDLDSFPGFMERVQDGTIEIRHEDWPTFLYASDTVYDPDNHELNLFRGYLVIRVRFPFLFVIIMYMGTGIVIGF